MSPNACRFPNVLKEDILNRLRTELGAATIISDPERMAPYGKDGTVGAFTMPDIVVEVTQTDQVQALLRLANEYHFPVIPRGLGTGLAGGAVPVQGGVVLSLAGMNRILSIEAENMIAVVEPGVLNKDFKEAVRARGLFYPPDPASLDTCSLGGNAATNAGGPACVKYGVTRDYILGLEAVLPTGELIATGVRTRKGVVGYDMTRLLVGSEGTLGVITRLILRLIPHPPAVTTLVALFQDLRTAMETIWTVLMKGHVPCALEFLDRRCLDLVGDLLPFPGGREAGALLLIETDGTPELIAREIEAIGEICMTGGATHVLMAPDARKREQIWNVRRAVSLRIEETCPVDLHEDIVVPIGRIAEMVDGLPALERRHDMKIYAFGHAGDGNIHLNITADVPEARSRVEAGVKDILEWALELGGTMSGEHGIGYLKREFLPLELAPDNIRLQKAIKNIFDPHHILNPGKIF